MSKSVHSNRKRILQIQFERKAEKFFSKTNSSIDEINELIITAVKKLSRNDVNIDLKQLKGELKGYFRIRKNDLRIIFNVIEDENLIVVTVVNIDFRGNVYK